MEHTGWADHEIAAGGEPLPRTGGTCDPQGSRREVIVAETDRERITIGFTGYLAQDPFAAAGGRQDD
ncbi:MAG: hypothetical protein H0V47_00600 [Chloroflexia bacterium]|nr:hypothetical protein [Chloroflexia bacterium]